MRTGRPQSVSGVSAVERALAVLTAFRRGDGSLSLAALAERSGLVKSTIMRLAVSLEAFGLLAIIARESAAKEKGLRARDPRAL